MPNGLWYASGPKRMDDRKPGSAFSKGDLLALDSNSSLSRLNPYAAVAGSVYAVAAADSIDSIRDKVPAIVVTDDTYFWCAMTAGQTPTTGNDSAISFAVALTGRYEWDGSAVTALLSCVEGVDTIDQSVQSKVIVKFRSATSADNIYHDFG